MAHFAGSLRGRSASLALLVVGVALTAACGSEDNKKRQRDEGDAGQAGAAGASEPGGAGQPSDGGAGGVPSEGGQAGSPTAGTAPLGGAAPLPSGGAGGEGDGGEPPVAEPCQMPDASLLGSVRSATGVAQGPIPL